MLVVLTGVVDILCGAVFLCAGMVHGHCLTQGQVGRMMPRTARQKQLLEAHRAETAAAASKADDVHANDRKLFAKLEEKRDKVEKLKFEISRIRVKEWEDGLTAGVSFFTKHHHKPVIPISAHFFTRSKRCVKSTDGCFSRSTCYDVGQERQVKANEDKIERLMEEIEEMEDNLADRCGASIGGRFALLAGIDVVMIVPLVAQESEPHAKREEVEGKARRRRRLPVRRRRVL